VSYKSADISQCGRYRYRWGQSSEGKGYLGFLMFNPSTADDREDDATIRKCTGFALQWGYSGFIVLNLYALRSSDPREILHLRAIDSPHFVGERNLHTLHAVGNDISGLLCAWGCESTSRRIPGFSAHADLCVRMVCAAQKLTPQQIGPPTKTGAPRHPLMAPYLSARIPFEVHA
jgi:hypothetical protein